MARQLLTSWDAGLAVSAVVLRVGSVLTAKPLWLLLVLWTLVLGTCLKLLPWLVGKRRRRTRPGMCTE